MKIYLSDWSQLFRMTFNARRQGRRNHVVKGDLLDTHTHTLHTYKKREYIVHYRWDLPLAMLESVILS